MNLGECIGDCLVRAWIHIKGFHPLFLPIHGTDNGKGSKTEFGGDQKLHLRDCRPGKVTDARWCYWNHFSGIVAGTTGVLIEGRDFNSRLVGDNNAKFVAAGGIDVL